MTQPPLPTAFAPPGSLPPDARSGARLGAALLAFVLAVVLVITLEPFQFARPGRLRVSYMAVPFDIAANVALFVPLGFLYRLARPPGDRLPRAAALRVLLLGLALSAAVECAQLFEADRYASPVDVLTNGTGALLGAWLHAALATRLRAGARVVGRLALELPLVSLVYLLVPLCWLGALTVGDGTAGVALLAALGLFGATVLGAVQGAYLGPAGVLSPRATGVAAAAWFLVGTLPALATRPAVVAPLTAVVAVAAWLMSTHATRTAGDRRADRRFELAALRLAAPFYGAFLLLLPVGAASDTGPLGQLTKLGILRRVETLTAFVVLGYIVAEALGRAERPYRADVRLVALWSGAAAATLAALDAGGLPSPHALLPVLLAVGAGAYGGGLYHLQRAHVQRLVAEGAAPAALPGDDRLRRAA